MIKEKMRAGDIDLIGGKLCLDFSNTVGWHASENPKENLNTYNDFVRWSLQVGILSEKDVQKLIRKAKENPSESKKVLRRAIKLREAIYRIFSYIAAGSLPKKEDLALLSLNLSKTRRWCDMKDCGNRAKARRFYKRTQKK